MMDCIIQAGEKVLSLEWLRDRSAEEARAYLMSIDGGPSNADCSFRSAS
jgi:hypothetical protein